MCISYNSREWTYYHFPVTSTHSAVWRCCRKQWYAFPGWESICSSFSFFLSTSAPPSSIVGCLLTLTEHISSRQFSENLMRHLLVSERLCISEAIIKSPNLKPCSATSPALNHSLDKKQLLTLLSRVWLRFVAIFQIKVNCVWRLVWSTDTDSCVGWSQEQEQERHFVVQQYWAEGRQTTVVGCSVFRNPVIPYCSYLPLTKQRKFFLLKKHIFWKSKSKQILKIKILFKSETANCSTHIYIYWITHQKSIFEYKHIDRGDTGVQWWALLPHDKKVFGSSHSINMHMRTWTGNSNLSLVLEGATLPALEGSPRDPEWWRGGTRKWMEGGMDGRMDAVTNCLQ